MKNDSPYAYTPDQRARRLKQMEQIAGGFYSAAARCGVHAFLEFCGLMTEYIKVCTAAHNEGQDYTAANTHSGVGLPFEDYNAAYLAEKLNCIYGMAFLQNKKVRDAFIKKLFEGEYRLECTRCEGTEQICNQCHKSGSLCTCPDYTLPTPMKCFCVGGSDVAP